MAKLSTILDQIDSGTLLLPEFQRGYVWNREQVRGLLRSLYLGNPVGGLLLWETEADSVSVRGNATVGGTHLLLLDGQQRITTLYGIIRGQPPAFFEGNAEAFNGLYFNVEEEIFQFYAPARMKDDPRWVDVTRLFLENLTPYVSTFAEKYPDEINNYIERLNRLRNILDRDFHEEKITGSDKTVDDVVQIFNAVNSGGTKLSKGDLALAKICAQWPDARENMRSRLGKWKESGFDFSIDWLLRNANAVATGRALFKELSDVSAEQFQRALEKSVDYIGIHLDAVSGRLGLDHDRVLMGRYAIPVVSRLLELNGGQFDDWSHRDRVLYWYVHASLWGRFAGSTESYLQKDYDTLERGGIDALIATLERWRGGNLDIKPHDFEVSTRGSRFYPLLYMLSRVHGARDFGSGLELKAEMLGRLTSLQVHHIFPKALLYKHGYQQREVNAVANFCFLTQKSNLSLGERAPQDYFAEVEDRNPGVLASQWIPTDPDLWRVERYHDFLEARRELLANAAQSFLTELRFGTDNADSAVLQPLAAVPDGQDNAQAAQINDLIEVLRQRGYAVPATDIEITDATTNRSLAIAAAYWPDGLRPGQGNPVVLGLDSEDSDLDKLKIQGYDVFTSVDSLLSYINRQEEGAESEPENEAEPGTVTPLPTAGTLEHEFAVEMRSVYDRGRQEANYTATHLLTMLTDLGSLTTAQKLLNAPAVSDGFAALWERGRLDLTVEALVLQPRFAELFDEREREIATKRLSQFGYRTA